MGEGNVQNFYYFVGDDSTTPNDTFTGGNGGWNAALFGDPLAKFDIQRNGPTTTITSRFLLPAEDGLSYLLLTHA